MQFRFKRTPRPVDTDPKPMAIRNEVLRDLEIDDLRTLRLQILISVLAGLTLAMLVEFITPTPRARESSEDQCPPSQFFDPLLNKCTDERQARVNSCRTNQKRDGCICDGGRTFSDEGLCVEAHSEGTTKDRCALAQKVITKCSEKRGGKTAKECSPEEFFVESAVGDGDFEALLAAFPGTFTLHFANNRPRSSGLKKAKLRKVAEQIKDLQPTIRSASKILLLARTDGVGGAAGNDTIALRRLDAAADALELVGDFSSSEAADFQRKLLPFGLGGNASMTIDAFDKRYTRIVDVEDRRRASSIANGLAAYRAKKLDKKLEKPLQKSLNRSVVVILIPDECSATPGNREG